MKTKSFLELADVKAIAAAAEAEALKNSWAVTIAISDDAGNLLWLQRLDGARHCLPISPQPKPIPLPWVAARARSTKTSSMVAVPRSSRRPLCKACWKAECPS
jgi:uncharacterized protein GlcG (DUF336 family)